MYRKDNWNKKRTIYCTNCGKAGHIFRLCTIPITSFGIIAIKKDIFGEKNITQSIPFCSVHATSTATTNTNTNNNNKVTPKKSRSTSRPLYLLIQRKNTMAFIDFIRGKYTGSGLIKIYLQEMTCEERHILKNKSFDYIWDKIWMNHNSKMYINSYTEAKVKYTRLDIKHLLETTQCCWTETEYGFPKGRRNMNETNLQCATREFREESGFKLKDFQIQHNLGTFEEKFIGTNGIHYKHIYYIAFIPNNVILPAIDRESVHQGGEIKGIGWYTLDECLDVFRTYDIEKKNVLCKVNNVIEDVKVVHNVLVANIKQVSLD